MPMKTTYMLIAPFPFGEPPPTGNPQAIATSSVEYNTIMIAARTALIFSSDGATRTHNSPSSALCAHAVQDSKAHGLRTSM